MANHLSHAQLPYPVKNARYTIGVPYLDADGDPTDPTTPDTEVSLDGGAYADCAEEVTTITGSNGSGYITLTGAETNGALVFVAAKVASGPKATLATLYPRDLPIIESGTAQAGSASSLTLASGGPAYDVTGCILRTTGGTGGGGVGGANNQARRIVAYDPSTKVATVRPNWETTPDATTTYDLLLPDGMALGALKALAPTTAGRTLGVDASGRVDVGSWLGTAPNALQSGRVDASVGAMAANVLTASAIASDAITAAKIADGAIDRATFAADTGLQSVRSGTAQGGASTSITLDASASATTDFYVGLTVLLTGGTGVGQARRITAYNGSTKVATITPTWATTPDATSTFALLPNARADVGAWLGTVVSTPATAGIPRVAIEAAADFAQAAADKVWSSATRTLTAFSTTLAVAVWDVLESAIATASSIGLKVKNNLDAAVSSRAPESGGNIAAIKAKTDQLTFTIANKVDASIQAAGDFAQAAADKVWSSATRTLTAFSTTLAVAVWDVLESAISVASSIGLKVKTNLDAAVSTRAPESGGNVAAIKAKTDNLPDGVKKNTALNNFMFVMRDATTHAPKTGVTVTAQRSIDGAAFSACANTPAEVASGWYKIDLAASDLNGDVIALRFTGTGADDTLITIVTQT